MHVITCSKTYSKDSWSSQAKAMYLDLMGCSLDSMFADLKRDNGNLITIIRRLGADAAVAGTTFSMVRIPDAFDSTDKWDVVNEVVKINGTAVTQPMTDQDKEIVLDVDTKVWCEKQGITYP